MAVFRRRLTTASTSCAANKMMNSRLQASTNTIKFCRFCRRIKHRTEIGPRIAAVIPMIFLTDEGEVSLLLSEVFLRLAMAKTVNTVTIVPATASIRFSKPHTSFCPKPKRGISAPPMETMGVVPSSCMRARVSARFTSACVAGVLIGEPLPLPPLEELLVGSVGTEEEAVSVLEDGEDADDEVDDEEDEEEEADEEEDDDEDEGVEEGEEEESSAFHPAVRVMLFCILSAVKFQRALP